MKATFTAVILQIMVIDIVFSLDSIITAVGMVDEIAVMVTAVVVSVALMMVFAGAIGRFVSDHPTIKVLALSFLVVVGVVLIAEGFDHHVPKGYIYFAMAFSVCVEMLNIRMRKRAAKPAHLHAAYASQQELDLRPLSRSHRLQSRAASGGAPSQPCDSSSSGSGAARASTIHTANGSFSGRLGAGRTTSSADSRATITPNAAGMSSALADAFAQHVPALAAVVQVGLALLGAPQVRQQVGAMHLDFMGHRFDVVLHGGVPDRIDVGHRHRPGGGIALADLGAQRQAPPHHAARALHLARDARHQRLVRVARGAVSLQRGRQHGDAGIGDAQRLAAIAIALALQQPGGEQLDLDQVLARPAGRAPDLAQASAMQCTEGAQRLAGQRILHGLTSAWATACAARCARGSPRCSRRRPGLAGCG